MKIFLICIFHQILLWRKKKLKDEIGGATNGEIKNEMAENFLQNVGQKHRMKGLNVYGGLVLSDGIEQGVTVRT
jgi:hypothetical protein